MLAFISKYRILVFLGLPLYFVLGLIHPILALVWSALFAFICWLQKNPSLLIINMLLVFLLGDIRYTNLLYFRDMRTVAITAVGIFTICDLLIGRYKLNKATFYILPFILVAFVAVAASPVPVTATIRTISYLLVIIVVYNFIYQHLIRTKGRFIEDIIYFAAWVYLVGLVFSLLGFEFPWLGKRYKGVFGNPNGVGLFSLVIVPTITYYAFILRPKAFSKRQLAFFYSLAAISLLLANSRNGMATILIFLGLWFLFSRLAIIKWSFYLIGIPSIVLMLTYVSIVDILEWVGLAKALRASTIEDGSGRTLSWTFALGQIPKKLWLGGGFYYEQYVYQNFVPKALRIFRAMHSTWNSYLTILLNTGVIGLTAYFSFLWFNYRASMRSAFEAAVFLAMLFAAFYEGWLSSSLNSYTIYFLILMAVFIARRNRVLT